MKKPRDLSSILAAFTSPALALAAVFAALATATTATTAQADNAPYIPVGSAKTKKTVIAFPAIKGDAALGRTISETATNDLAFMDLFKFLSQSAFVEPATAGITLDKFKLSDWTSIQAEFVLKAEARTEGRNLVLEAYLYDTFGAKQVLAKRYVAASSEIKTVGHTLANDVVTALTGLPGIFLTKIAMSCDRTGKKEIYVMDFDGTDVKQVTHHRSIAFAPAWSPEGTKIAYSLYTRHRSNVKNIDLYEFDFATNTVRLLSNRKGMNSGAAYHPTAKGRLALTMSFLGSPHIFTLDPGRSQVTRITKSLGFEVDPSWNPDGSKIAFVSDRTGSPMIYSQNIDGSNVKRLTYAGKYNATPSWSPQNNKIAFAGDLGTHFDVFIMNPDGTNIERLTKDQGNNEDPYFSPDGNFIVFSSNRTGQKNIYVMNVDGTFVKRLTYGLGNCVSPKWSAPPKPVTTLAPKK